jgi:hypothetical protein
MMFISFVFRDTPMLTAGLGRPFAFAGGIFLYEDDVGLEVRMKMMDNGGQDYVGISCTKVVYNRILE